MIEAARYRALTALTRERRGTAAQRRECSDEACLQHEERRDGNRIGPVQHREAAAMDHRIPAANPPGTSALMSWLAVPPKAMRGGFWRSVPLNVMFGAETVICCMFSEGSIPGTPIA